MALTEAGVPIDGHGLVLPHLLRSMGREKAADLFEQRWAAIQAIRLAREAAPHGQQMAACRAVADRLAIPIGTLYRWEDAVEKFGQAALVPARKPTEGMTTVPREIRKQVLLEWTTQQASVAQLARLADGLCTARGLMTPSIYAIRRWLQRARRPKSIELAHRKGKKAYSDQYVVRVRRNPEQLAVGEMWVGDHRLADVMVRASVHPSAPVFRPMITAFADVCSAEWVGWVVREQPSSEGVGAAIRRACLGFEETDLKGNPLTFPPRGLPDICLIDNGKEFWGGSMRAALDFEPSEGDFIPDRRHLTVMTQLGIREVQCIPFNPQSKPIEAFFVSLAADERILPGWCGRNAIEKPEALRRQLDRGQLLTLAEYRSWLAGWVARRGIERPIGQRRLPPAAYWQGIAIRPVDPAQLDDLLPRDRWITPGNSLISIKGIGIYAPIPEHRAAYLAARGYRCRMLFAHDDPGKIRLIHGADRIICLRVPEGDEWALARGGEPSPQFREVQTLNKVGRRLIAESAADLVDGVQPQELDPDGAWAAATANIVPPAERRPAPRTGHRLALGGPPARVAPPRRSSLADHYAQVPDPDPLGLLQEPPDA